MLRKSTVAVAMAMLARELPAHDAYYIERPEAPKLFTLSCGRFTACTNKKARKNRVRNKIARKSRQVNKGK